MSITDPFNRLGRKRDKEYLAFQEQLKQAGVDSEEKARTVLQKSRGRMFGFCAVVVVVTFVVALILPDLKGIVITSGSLTLLWLLTIMARGQRMMRQFIEQEFVRNR